MKKKETIAVILAFLVSICSFVMLSSNASASTAKTYAASHSCSTFPLPAGHAYAMDNGTIYTHSGKNATDRSNIMKIQRIINNQSGYSRVAVDGVFGAATKAGVIDFQKYLNSEGAHISTDGQYGQATWTQAWNYGFGGFQC